MLAVEDVDYREQVEDWEYLDEDDSLYSWSHGERHRVDIYEDEEDDGFVVDYRDESEICSGLMWDWSFEEEEEAFHYAQDFMQFFDELEYSKPR